MSNEDIVRRYCQAFADRDFATAESLRAPGWEARWPQTRRAGHLQRGDARRSSRRTRAVPWEGVERRLIGAEDSLVVTPLGQLVRIAGNGDTWAAEWIEPLPGRHRLVRGRRSSSCATARSSARRTYWAPVLDAPPWRREWVELDQAAG